MTDREGVLEREAEAGARTSDHAASAAATDVARHPVPASAPGDTLGLIDVLIVIAKRKLMIGAIVAAVAVASVIYVLMLPNMFTATAKLVPGQQQNQSSAAMMLGQLGAIAGIGGGMSLKSPSDMYVGMLKSRTVADGIIARFKLQALYEANTMDATRAALAGRTSMSAAKDGLITIEVDDTDPARAAAIANAFPEELEKLSQRLAITEASQRRLFFERQLQQAKTHLTAAEVAARSALQRGGVTMVDAQGKSMIDSIARLRAQITLKEVQINSMRSFASDENPELRRAHQELAALQQQLAKLEGTGGQESGGATEGSAQRGLKNLSLLRDVKYNEVLFELLAKQYELAKIDEAREAIVVQVLDPAVPPDRKSKPQRASLVLMSTFSALIAAVLLAFFLEARDRARQDPRRSARLAELREYLSLGASRAMRAGGRRWR